jgi:hypothetical protein
MKAKTPNICGFALSAETLLWMMTWGCRPWLSCRENSPPIAWRAEIRIRSSSGDRIRVATLDLSKMGGELSRMVWERPDDRKRPGGPFAPTTSGETSW